MLYGVYVFKIVLYYCYTTTNTPLAGILHQTSEPASKSYLDSNMIDLCKDVFQFFWYLPADFFHNNSILTYWDHTLYKIKAVCEDRITEKIFT